MPPSEIERLVCHALSLATDARYLKDHPGEILGMLADAHPFLDGNGRALLLVFMELCCRAGFAIDWSRTTKDGYLNALSEEIRDPSKGHLDVYLRPCVIGIKHRDQWPVVIAGIKGLDGLDKENVSYASLDDPDVRQRYAHHRSSKP